MRKEITKEPQSKAVLIATIILGLFCTINTLTVLEGFIDIAFLMPLAVAIYIFIGYDFSKLNHFMNFSLAVSLVMAWICRRYVAFFLIGFVAAMVFKAIVFASKNGINKHYKCIILNFLEIGLTSFAILIIFLHNFLINQIRFQS